MNAKSGDDFFTDKQTLLKAQN